MKAVFRIEHQLPYRAIIKKFFIKKYWGLTFFQTDKPIYRPNEVVRFRFIRLDENFVPIDDNCTIIIQVIELKLKLATIEPLIIEFN